jgi:hypothetical protein
MAITGLVAACGGVFHARRRCPIDQRHSIRRRQRDTSRQLEAIRLADTPWNQHLHRMPAKAAMLDTRPLPARPDVRSIHIGALLGVEAIAKCKLSEDEGSDYNWCQGRAPWSFTMAV